MKKNSQLLYNALFTLVFTFLPLISLLAQDPGGFDDPTAGIDVPIDGGLSLLIAAGVGYGIKKVRDERKKSKEAKEGVDK